LTKSATNPGRLRGLTMALLLVALTASFVVRLWPDETLATWVARLVCGMAFAASLVAFSAALARPADAGVTAIGPRVRRDGHEESSC
jgi:hypothetical protein